MILDLLRRLLGIRSPSRTYADAMRYLWAGWDSGTARVAWKRRHRLTRVRARIARGDEYPVTSYRKGQE